MDEEMEQMEEEMDAAEAEVQSSTVMYQCEDNCSDNRAFFDPGTCEHCGKELAEI